MDSRLTWVCVCVCNLPKKKTIQGFKLKHQLSHMFVKENYITDLLLVTKTNMENFHKPNTCLILILKLPRSIP